MKLPTALKRVVRPIVRPVRRELATLAAIMKLRWHGADIPRLAEHADRMGGKFPKTCPICSYHGPFKPFGNPLRWDARCPKCGSLERHRQLALFLNGGEFERDLDILHFAPERCVETLLRPLAKRYLTADLYEQGVDLKLNIEAIDLPDESFDIILCSHVLPYADDTKALPELRRILRRNGKLLLMNPIVENAPTYEDSTITTQDEQENHFGHHDRPIRRYGSDFRNRLCAAGFSFKENVAHGRTAIDYGLRMGETLFICSRVIG